jgi:hypothetical protein
MTKIKGHPVRTVPPKWLLHSLWLVPISVFVAQCATTRSGTLGCEGGQICSDELTIREAEEYCRYAVGERKKVERFWGATWNEPIRITSVARTELAEPLGRAIPETEAL